MANPGDFSAKWTVPLSDGVHTVQFEHGTTSGKRVIVVDGEEVFRKNWMFRLVGKEHFQVGKKRACVKIEAQGLTYEYVLDVDGKTLQKFVENRRKTTKTWLPCLRGEQHRVVFEKDTMEVFVDGQPVETAGEFVEDGTETHFTIQGDSGAYSCLIKAVSSGKRRQGIVHTLIAAGQEIPEVTGNE
eukprot:m.6477 g.6477  ORF g.6477 m.6477 type:complete len:186 (+) comp15978_c0_seq1:193-750(+)